MKTINQEILHETFGHKRVDLKEFTYFAIVHLDYLDLGSGHPEDIENQFSDDTVCVIGEKVITYLFNYVGEFIYFVHWCHNENVWVEGGEVKNILSW